MATDFQTSTTNGYRETPEKSFSEFDDASSTGGQGTRADIVQPQGSAWDRVRQGAVSKPAGQTSSSWPKTNQNQQPSGKVHGQEHGIMRGKDRRTVHIQMITLRSRNPRRSEVMLGQKLRRNLTQKLSVKEGAGISVAVELEIDGGGKCIIRYEWQ